LKNAQAFEKAGAARLVLDAEMTGARLVEEVTRLTHTPGLLDDTSAAARAFAQPGAAQRAADVLESINEAIDRR
jgi:UDP-N-acetylglucosamine--N-acetylmuramyl-(pentapeptide) pyrophosphoryl-undecaprenol N-acetylglucosamine transferase